MKTKQVVVSVFLAACLSLAAGATPIPVDGPVDAHVAHTSSGSPTGGIAITANMHPGTLSPKSKAEVPASGPSVHSPDTMDSFHDVQLTSDPEKDVPELSDLLSQARGATSLDKLPTIEKFHVEVYKFRRDAKPYLPRPNSRRRKEEQQKPMSLPKRLISTQKELEELLEVVLQSLTAMEERIASGSSSGKQPPSSTQPEISKLIKEWQAEKTRFYKEERVSSSPSTE